MTNKKNMILNVTILLLYSTPISGWGEEIWRSNSDQEMLFSGILQHYHYKQLEKQKISWLSCLCSSSHRLVRPRCWQNMFKLFTKQQQYPVNLILRCISHRCSKFVQHILRSCVILQQPERCKCHGYDKYIRVKILTGWRLQVGVKVWRNT